MQTHARVGSDGFADLGVEDDQDRDDEVLTSSLPPLAGEFAFVSPEGQLQRTAELLGRGAVVVSVPPLPRALRGRLAEHIEERVERELAARGAPSPYLAAWSTVPDDDDAEARLADQLFRARTVGASGIAFLLGSLAGAAKPYLDPCDSATLRVLAKGTTHAPVVLLLDDGDVSLDAFGAPVPLSSLMADASFVQTIAMAASDALPTVADELDADALLVDDDRGAPEIVAASAEDASEDEPHHDEAPVVHETSRTALQAAMHDALLDDDDRVATSAHGDDERPDDDFADEAPALHTTQVDAQVAPVVAPPKAKPPSATVAVPTVGPSDAWRSWAVALGAARGPQALTMLERLFTENYVPLANAIAGGLDDARALRAYDEFRRGFERTYADAFATFGVTGRRPRLVMDAYEAAMKQARAHDARTVNILVVDSMRFDLGTVVRDALVERTSGRASLTSASLLWSSLPTTTFRQLETLARGMDALRAPMVEEATDSLRGRAAETVRRLRVGSRELYKLDIVPSMLGSVQDVASLHRGSPAVIAALPAIGEAVAEAIARHIDTLAPRTLLFVIGDHGFCIDRRGAVSHGGASPEEVLVPALSYLVGDLH